jgi:site-specific DNA-methyltransferase (adenine-specific)
MQKLVWMCRGDLILDPFLGSGTTAVVCERLGRRWLGCELNPDYAAMAEARIERERQQLQLSLD